MSSWWSKATTEQKLAQIDGGIELGMTADQVGMNVGANGFTVRIFGYRHNRRFKGTSAKLAEVRKGIVLRSKRKSAEYKGEIAEEAFGLFGSSIKTTDMFDEILT